MLVGFMSFKIRLLCKSFLTNPTNILDFEIHFCMILIPKVLKYKNIRQGLHPNTYILIKFLFQDRLL